MIVIRNWNDMEKYGITCLTGEACAYGYRLLCDLTMAGNELIKECFGFRKFPSDMLPASWNRGINSIMLPYCMLEPLAIFALFQAGCTRVYVTYEGDVRGIEPSDDPEQVELWVKYSQGTLCEECRRYGKGGGINRTYANPGYARNKHQMSGRTE